jgi:hypothetical protein
VRLSLLSVLEISIKRYTLYNKYIYQVYSLVIITSNICISADEKDRDSIFTTVTTIWKPGFRATVRAKSVNQLYL